jgi:hypothetical protein
MRNRNSRMSEAEAHQELLLMDSRVAGLIDENYLDRFRRMDLPYSGLLARFQDLLLQTRWCGGHLIHLGKLLCNEILEFMESDHQVPSGMLLESALKALGTSLPFLGSLLAPIAAEVECQGFSKLLDTDQYTKKLNDRARVFFRRFAEVLNTSQKLLADPNEKGVDAVTFAEPALFELGDSDNPFDLEEVSALSPAAAATAKFLVKLAAADGHFGDPERQLIFQAMERMGESLTEDQYHRLVSEASHESVEHILKPTAHESVVFREKLLLLAMLLSVADGQVNTIEKKLLAQALPFLGVSKQRYSEISGDALALIKARRHSPPDTAESLTQAPMQRTLVPSESSRQAENRTAGLPAPGLPIGSAACTSLPAGVTESSRALPEQPLVPHELARSHSSGQSATPDRQPGSPVPERKIWRCPACRMPQFSEFEECPQCGVIVSKFRQKLARSWEDSDEACMVEIPPDEVDELPPESAGRTPSREQTDVSDRCEGCRIVLPTGAKFCPSCGTRAG